MADDRMSYRAPFMQWASIYLVAAFALALALGVTGDFAACGWIHLPALGYHSLLLAIMWRSCSRPSPLAPNSVWELRFWPRSLTSRPATIACGQAISAQGEVLAFIVVGLLAGFLVKSTQMSAGKITPETSLAKATRPDRDEGIEDR